MHRSRPFVLVILAAAAACSKRDPNEGNDILSQDRTLAARIENAKDSHRLTLPDACGAITVAASPSTANQQQAEELTRQAGVAEVHGNIDEARSLLHRASQLDATNKSTAYHLGRTSEALGDRTTAMTAYCRYLTLAPTRAESVEARQRVADLSRSVPSVTGSVSDSVAVRRSGAAAPTRSVASEHSTGRPHIVGSAGVRRSATATTSARVAESPSVVASGDVRSQTPRESPSMSTNVDGTRGRAAEGDVVATSRPAPTSDQPSTASSSQRSSSIGVQSAIIGVATGAIIGAMTGRNVKSAVIGAAAGGVLGTVVGTTTRPARRGMRS